MIEPSQSLLREIPGGSEVLNWFGKYYDFHDAEILRLELNRRSPSFLRIYGYGVGKDGTGAWVSQKHAIITFTLDGVYDLELDGFSHQNVIGSLTIARVDANHERKPFFDFSASENSFEIILEPCYGMDGVIRCNSILVTLEPGRQKDHARK